MIIKVQQAILKALIMKIRLNGGIQREVKKIKAPPKIW